MHRANKIGFSFSALTLAMAALACAPLAVHAQQGASMPSMSSTAEAQSAPASGKGATGDSTTAFKAADERMMKAMQGSAYTGNADEDFVSHMIPHHQGAVDMAEVEAKYGKDPQLKRLAKRIIDSQRREIQFMKSWQEKHGNQ
ncbi:CopM family metallochaperone [Trinickia sp.]|uniref:CopM family metallochaperone n=1 Tax=Trinickia sp. TaxID=2571163 RepID=UPI003F7D5D95